MREQIKGVVYVFICLLCVVLLGSCNYSSWHQGFKEQKTNKCYDEEGLLQTECLDSLDYNVEDYEEERKKQLGSEQ